VGAIIAAILALVLVIGVVIFFAVKYFKNRTQFTVLKPTGPTLEDEDESSVDNQL